MVLPILEESVLYKCTIFREFLKNVNNQENKNVTTVALNINQKKKKNQNQCTKMFEIVCVINSKPYFKRVNN